MGGSRPCSEIQREQLSTTDSDRKADGSMLLFSSPYFSFSQFFILSYFIFSSFFLCSSLSIPFFFTNLFCVTFAPIDRRDPKVPRVSSCVLNIIATLSTIDRARLVSPVFVIFSSLATKISREMNSSTISSVRMKFRQKFNAFYQLLSNHHESSLKISVQFLSCRKQHLRVCLLLFLNLVNDFLDPVQGTFYSGIIN